MSNYTASFRRFTKHTFSKEEIALVEALERQRLRTRRVRAVIDDPTGKYQAVLTAYLSYTAHLNGKDTIIITPRRSSVAPMLGRTPRVITPRSYLRLLSPRRPVGQILLLASERYCTSLPLYRSRLDAILTLALPLLAGPDTVLIVQGSTATAKNTAFKKYHQMWQSQPHPAAFLLWSPDMEGRRPRLPIPRQNSRPKPLIVQWRPSHGRIILPSFHPAIPIRLTPQKIAA